MVNVVRLKGRLSALRYNLQTMTEVMTGQMNEFKLDLDGQSDDLLHRADVMNESSINMPLYKEFVQGAFEESGQNVETLRNRLYAHIYEIDSQLESIMKELD